MKKIYPFGYNSAAIEIMKSRTATENAKLFLRYATPGMRVLDVGSGPGTITVGLASTLTSSEVVGIDIESSQIEIAEELAKEKKLANCKFQTASIYELPFEDNSFDAVFGHTILMQLKDVERALSEIRRVLKPGGLVGFREVDFSSNLFYPDDSSLKELMQIFRRSFLYNDSNPDIGRSLASILSIAKFDVREFCASYSQASTQEGIINMYDSMISLWEQAEFPTQALELGWISEGQSASLPERLRKEAKLPGTINGICYVEVVAINS